MSEVRYDAHPSMFCCKPFKVLISILFIVIGILIAISSNQFVPKNILDILAQFSINLQAGSKSLQIVGIGLFVLGMMSYLLLFINRLSDRLVITEDELIWTHGLMNRKYTEINLSSIRTVTINQTIWQRIVDAGDIDVFTSGDNSELTVSCLRDPSRIRELLKNPKPTGDSE